MKTRLTPLFTVLLLAAGLVTAAAAEEKIRVLVVTGGHSFETNQFYRLFEENEEITWKKVVHPEAHARLKKAAAAEYDVLVVYDMWSASTEEARADFRARLKDGKGLVALHHCLASYPDWDEYRKIIGGKYHLNPRIEDGVTKGASTYKHDVEVPVHVVTPAHPVTRGLKDFQIHDETYGNFEVLPGVTPLLTTDHPTSSPTLAWVHNYGGARVVYIQLGHDHLAYENPNFQRLLAQAIRWAARRD